MSKTLVLECNRNSATVNSQNADYEIELAKPIVVNAGDQISLKMASIDSQKVSDDNIVIADDTRISLTFSYYDVNYTGNTAHKRSPDLADLFDGGKDFEYYASYCEYQILDLRNIAVHIVGYEEPIISAQEIGAGSFVLPPSLGSDSQRLKAHVTYLDASGVRQDGILYGSNASYNASLYGWYANGSTITMSPKTQIQYLKGTLRITGYTGIWPDRKTAPTTGAAVPSTTRNATPINVNVKNDQFKYDEEDIDYAVVGSTTPKLFQQTVNALIPQGTYDRKALAVYMTQLLASTNGVKPKADGAADQKLIPNNPLLIRTDDQTLGANLLFRKVDFTDSEATIDFTKSNAYRYYDGANFYPYFVGANQFAIEYGSTGNVFSLSYAHTPLLNPAEPAKQNIGYFWTGTASSDLRYNLVRTSTGIVIHDLQPVEFWKNELGLYSQLIVPIRTSDDGIPYYVKDSMEPKIPKGYAPLSSMFFPSTGGADPRLFAPIPPSATAGVDVKYIDVTGLTEQIIGDTVTTNLSGGYYFIEVLGLPSNRGGLVDESEENPRVFAIVSKQYSSNSIITGFSDSGITYTHQGLGQMISKLRVRILDERKNVVDDLGENNTVFIQLDKALQPEEQQEEDKNKSQNQKRGEK